MRPVYYVVLAAILVVLLIIFATTAMVYYYRRSECFNNPQINCYNDWACGPSTNDPAAETSCIVKECRKKHPNMPAAEFECVMAACAPNEKGEYPCKCEFLWKDLCRNIDDCGPNPTIQEPQL